jgi:hypothetical protein
MSKYAKVLSGLLMAVSLAAHADVITVSGNAFDDLGASTVDMTTHLEWMDFSQTTSRSTCSIALDIGHKLNACYGQEDGLDLIPASAGWRIATRAETAQLLSDWMGVPVALSGTGYSGGATSRLVAQFLNVFADGATVVRPNFYPDALDSSDAVGFFVGYGLYNMSIANSNIYINNGVGTALVRDTIATIPEPGPLALMAIALPAFLRARRHRS